MAATSRVEERVGKPFFNTLIEALAMEPRPGGVKKLEGAADFWRIRVGDWRVVYRISDSGA
jgi:mRNA interferase RelE/StbE